MSERRLLVLTSAHWADVEKHERACFAAFNPFPPIAADITEHLRANPRLAWEVVAELAPKLAGPWEQGGGDAVRRVRAGRIAAYAGEKHDDYWEWSIFPKGHCQVSVEGRGVADMEAAMVAADTALRAAGYILVDEESADV